LFSKERLRWILCIALICVLATSALVAINYLMTTRVRPTPLAPNPLNVPDPPSAAGCYWYSETGGWRSVNCPPRGEDPGGHALEGTVSTGVLGVQSVSSQGSTGNPSLIARASLQVSFTSYSGEIDSQREPAQDAYSIQLNTNYFNGSNNDDDAVQFMLQTVCFPLSGNTTCAVPTTENCTTTTCGGWTMIICAGPLDITTKDYSHVQSGWIPAYVGGIPVCTPAQCSPIPKSVEGEPVLLSSSLSIQIRGDIQDGNLVTTAYILSGGPTATFSVSAPDIYNLAANWYQASGTILGEANGSEATFLGTTTEQTDIFATTCTAAAIWNCNSPAMNGQTIGYSPYAIPVYGTTESNNLGYSAQPTLSCSNGQCEFQTQSCLPTSTTTSLNTLATCFSGIPGFPLEATLIGAVMGLTIILIRRRSRHHPTVATIYPS